MRRDAIRILFPTAFRYPSLPAEWRFGLEQARGFAAVLGNRFLYIVERVADPAALAGIAYRETQPRRALGLRRWHLLTVYNFFWFLKFFLRHPAWRAADTVLYITERKIGLIALIFRKLFRFRYRAIFESHGHEEPWLDRFLYRNADHVIFVTRSMYDTALRAGTIGAEQRVSIFPAAVNLHKFEAVPDDTAALRKELNLPLGKKVLMQAGRYKALGFDKGVKNLIEVIARIPDTEYIGCFVGGTADEIAEARSYAERLGVAKRCIFVPFVDEHKILRYLKAADALVYIPPPEKFFLYENSPMKLFEFMASRRPIVLADYPGLREGLDDETALFVRTDDLKSAAAAIAELARDKGRAERMAEAAYERARENTWEKRAEKIVTIAAAL